MLPSRDTCSAERNEARAAVLAANIIMFDAAERAIRALSEVGIRTAPIKGAWLVDRIYRDPGLRRMVDVDLLAETDGRERAHAAMAERARPGSRASSQALQ